MVGILASFWFTLLMFRLPKSLAMELCEASGDEVVMGTIGSAQKCPRLHVVDCKVPKDPGRQEK